MHSFHDVSRLRAGALLLAGLGLAAGASIGHAQDLTVTPLVSLTGSSGAAPGSRPFLPPVWVESQNRIYGTTRTGAATASSDLTHGVAYGLDPSDAASSYTASPLGESIGFSISTLALLKDGRLLGVTSHGIPASGYIPLGGFFTLTNGLVQSETITASVDIGKPRGAMAVDGQGNAYVGSTTLLARKADGSYRQLFDFNTAIETTGGARVYTKGAVPGILVWSEQDQALYGMSYFMSDAKATYPGVPATDKAAGSLIKISAQALQKNALVADDIEVLHFFALSRDGTPSMGDGVQSGLIEDGEWLYGTLTEDSAKSQGRVWRMRKSDPSSFVIAADFAVDLTAPRENETTGVPAKPNGPLVRAADGHIYGVSRRDSRQVAYNASGKLEPVAGGTLYRIVVGQANDRSDDRLEVVHYFDAPTGASPVGLSAGPVVEGRQLIYGATEYGGSPADVCYKATATATRGVSTCTGHGSVFQASVGLPTVGIADFLVNGHASATVAANSKVTLTWSSTHATTCAADGDWAGAKLAEGNEEIGPLATGTHTFRLACTGESGVQSEERSVVVTVEADQGSNNGGNNGGSNGESGAGGDSGSSGGGGALSGALLLPFIATLLIRRRKRG